MTITFVYAPEDGDCVVIGQQPFPDTSAASTIHFIADRSTAEQVQEALLTGAPIPTIEERDAYTPDERAVAQPEPW